MKMDEFVPQLGGKQKMEVFLGGERRIRQMLKDPAAVVMQGWLRQTFSAADGQWPFYDGGSMNWDGFTAGVGVQMPLVLNEIAEVPFGLRIPYRLWHGTGNLRALATRLFGEAELSAENTFTGERFVNLLAYDQEANILAMNSCWTGDLEFQHTWLVANNSGMGYARIDMFGGSARRSTAEMRLCRDRIWETTNFARDNYGIWRRQLS